MNARDRLEARRVAPGGFSPRRRLLALVAGSLVALLPCAAAADSLADGRVYHGIVKAYRQGDAEAVRRIDAWDAKRMLGALERVSIPGEEDLPWDAAALAAAAFMHVEAAWLHLSPGERPRADAHLLVADHLLGKGAPALDALSRRWYVAVARALRARGEARLAERVLELGRGRLPRDVAVLCESGELAEFLATDTSLASQGELEERVNLLWAHHTANIEHAERWLGDAVKAGSAYESCRLHHARVLVLRGRYDEARPALAALQSSGDPTISYLASMFLGGAAERSGKKTEAEQAYRQAADKAPQAHAAHVALASVLLSQGRADEARASLERALDGERNSRREPWWWYFAEPKSVTAARLEALRKEVLP